MVDCYLAKGRFREASASAQTALKLTYHGHRELVLMATALMRNPGQKSGSKAQEYLEKALNIEPNYLPAVYLLAEVSLALFFN